MVTHDDGKAAKNTFERWGVVQPKPYSWPCPIQIRNSAILKRFDSRRGRKRWRKKRFPIDSATSFARPSFVFLRHCKTVHAPASGKEADRVALRWFFRASRGAATPSGSANRIQPPSTADGNGSSINPVPLR